MLSKLLVQCDYCNQMNIERGDFDVHVNDLCPKVVVGCPGYDNICTWLGPREKCSIHFTKCTAEVRCTFLYQLAAIKKQIAELQFELKRIAVLRRPFVTYDELKSAMLGLEERYKCLGNDYELLKLQLSELDQQSESLQRIIPAIRRVEPVQWINVHRDAKWTSIGYLVAGRFNLGTATNQLCNPYGFYIDDNLDIYIADSKNDRIMKWCYGATFGELVAGGNEKGDRSNQLNCPTDVIVDKTRNCLIICDYKNRRVVRWPLRNGTSGETIISNIDCHGLTMADNGFLYVTDYKKDEVRRYQVGQPHGIVVAGGRGKGNRLDQLNGPIYLFVGRDNSLYVSDECNHRIMKWSEDAKEGVIVAGGRYAGSDLAQLSEPGKIIVDAWKNIYVADWGNQRIMRWPEGAKQGQVVVGSNDEGNERNQLNRPISLSFDLHGDLYVADQWNHVIFKFDMVQNY